jgi:type I restriction enzyme S subunit
MTAVPSVPLKGVVRQVSSWNPLKPGAKDVTFWYVDLSAVDQDLKEIKGARIVARADAPSRARQLLQAGDVLVSTVRPNLNGVAFVPSELDGATASTGFCVIRANTELLEPSYVFHWVKSPDFIARMVSQATGASYPAVSDRIILESEIPLPSLSEQRQIGAILGKADELRRKRRQAFAQLDRLAQSIFLQLFGDPKFNPKGWPLKAIESVVLDMKGGAALEPEDFVSYGFPVLHKGAIKPAGQTETDPKKKAFAELEYAKGRPQNIVNRDYVAVTLRDLVPTGPSIGLAADLRHAAQDQYLLAQGAYGLRLDPAQMHPDYFVQLSNMPNFRHVLRQHAVGSTQIHIRNPVYLSIRMPVPPVDLQLRFASLMHNLRHQTRCAEGSLIACDRLFGALQSRGFRGEL